MEGLVDTAALFAVAGHRDAAHLAYLGLHAMQARGTDGAAIAASDGHMIRRVHGRGSVAAVLDGAQLRQLTGPAALGLVYGSGAARGGAMDEAPPERLVFGRYSGGQVAIALAGRFTNGTRLRRELHEQGAVLHGPSDAEVLLQLVARSGQRTLVNRLVDALWKVQGAYAIVVATEDRVVALRDPRGFRPLVVGHVGDGVALATEDAAIRFIGGKALREVAPGELVVLDGRGAVTVSPFPRQPRARCAQELISLSSQDATVFQRDTWTIRRELGARLATAAPCPEAEVVIGLPGAAHAAAQGFAERSGTPWACGFVAGRDLGGRLEEPPGGMPRLGARLRWTAVPALVRGKRVVLVAPSLVTGRGLERAVALLADVGAQEVHLRIMAPPIRAACCYGVATPTTDELVAHTRGEGPELAMHLGVPSLRFLPLDALREVLGGGEGLCDACLGGEQPLPPEEPDDQLPLF